MVWVLSIDAVSAVMAYRFPLARPVRKAATGHRAYRWSVVEFSWIVRRFFAAIYVMLNVRRTTRPTHRRR
jgi:hypothetical protein